MARLIVVVVMLSGCIVDPADPAESAPGEAESPPNNEHPEPAAPHDEGGNDAPCAAKAMRWIVVADTSQEENFAGTPGVDICGAWAECDGVAVTAVEASVVLGEGQFCTANDPECLADRTDPDAALDDGAPCEATSAPSDYVSVGLGGVLVLGFDRDLSGCTLFVEEYAGGDWESYEVFACERADTPLRGCSALGSAPEGGALSMDVGGACSGATR